ncbi:MAG: hypothetical protein JSW28_10355 [Thermoplasmata archaeon]|nr:MAG: hypothetical protein JSW28_10355 [Thermoplasmata archaeon]
MKLAVKTPFSYVLWLIILFIIALLVVVPLISIFTGILDIDSVYFWVVGAIVSWSAMIILALIGAIFVGMLLSHRILSVGSFTPFEEEMLKMRQDITAINEKLETIMAEGGLIREEKGGKKEV